MKRFFVSCLAISLAAVLSAVEVKQVFLPERYVRGNENVVSVQPLDDASWIWADDEPIWGVAFLAYRVEHLGANAERTPFYRFRRTFTAAGEPLRFDVSADERFTLYLDGKPIARGPHRGLVNHWYYQSYEVTGLTPGEHVLEAVVWQLGQSAPHAQLSYRGGFVLKAAGAYDKSLTTGKAAWQVAPLVNTRMTGKGESGTFGVGDQCEVRGTAFAEESPTDWRQAVVIRGPVRAGRYGGRTGGWLLFPTERPDPMHVPKAPGRFRAARDGADEKGFYRAADAASPWTDAFNGLLAGKPVTVPPQTDVRLVWDLDDYYCAYPELRVTGGAGARLEWGWAESLRTGQAFDARRGRNMKANRDEFDGKNMRQAFRDVFLPDGRADALFAAPWWRCGRWCELRVKTGDAPVTLTSLTIAETRYPLRAEGTFASNDVSLVPVEKVCRRAMEMCMHEMLFDCPYYEQQMYPGDTRIQLQILSALTRDDRMLRFAMSAYDFGRRDNGFVAMNFPSHGVQESSTYTMCWIFMFRDYLMWHDNPAFLRARMTGVRNALMGLALYENADGLLENLPGWSFMDWVKGRFDTGKAPNGGVGEGVSSLNNLQYLYALQSAASVDEALGETTLAAHWRAKAAALGERLVATFWDQGRGLLADTPAKDCFSEHAQCLAILTGILSPDQRACAFDGLVTAPDLARVSTYFAYYLFETYVACGRADLLMKRLDDWRNFVAWGARTAFETQHQESRSDCHAWSACPIYFFHSAFAGVTPSAPFFRTVRVAPQPAGLAEIRAKTPCPQGFVETDFHFAGETVRGTVTLPPGLTGTFEWKGQTRPLLSGVNEIK